MFSGGDGALNINVGVDYMESLTDQDVLVFVFENAEPLKSEAVP